MHVIISSGNIDDWIARTADMAIDWLIYCEFGYRKV